MKQYVLLITMILALAFSAGCMGGNQIGTEDTITISGAFAIYPMMIKWTEEYQKVNPDVKFQISAGGAGKGMTDALSNMVDIGMVSRQVYPQEQQQGAVWVSVAKDAVVGTINADNPVLDDLQATGVNKETLDKLYITGEITTWGELVGRPDVTDRINVYTRADACGAASVWAEYFGYTQEDLGGTGVSGDPGVAEAVRADQFGIGYNNINFAYDTRTGRPIDGITIIPLDINGDGKIDPDEDFYATRGDLIDAIGSGSYPSPPARNLHLVTKDGFTGATKDFVAWILTDGQQYVLETGYLPLSDSQLAEELSKLQ